MAARARFHVMTAKFAVWGVIGMAIGVAIGVATGNLASGIAMGIGIGVVFAISAGAFEKKSK